MASLFYAFIQSKSILQKTNQPASCQQSNDKTDKPRPRRLFLFYGTEKGRELSQNNEKH